MDSRDVDNSVGSTRRRGSAARLSGAFCALVRVLRAVDDPGRWVLAVRFASVDAYRRALSPFEVREHVIPLLSEALTDEPATYETLVDATEGTATDHPSLRA